METKIKKNMFLITFLVILKFSSTASSTCSENQVRCLEKEKCIPLGYICDNDNDCGSMSDESFCTEWKNPDCPKGQVRCIRGDLDACVYIPFYCQVTDPPCTGSLDLRICEMMEARQIMNMSSLAVPTTLPQTNFTTVSPFTTEGQRVDVDDDLSSELDVEDDPPSELVISIDLDECPANYTRVGNECFSLYTVLKMSEWRNTSCSRGYANCTRNGETHCISIYAYCDMVNPPCSGDFDYRMCKILKNATLESYSRIETASEIKIEDDVTGNVTTSLQCGNDLFYLVGEKCMTIYYLFKYIEWRGSSCSTRGYERCERNGFDLCIPVSLYCDFSDPPCGNRIEQICNIMKDPVLTSHPSILSLSNAPAIASTSAPSEGTSQDGTSALATANATLTLVCPEMHTLVGTECLSVYYVMKMVEWRQASCSRGWENCYRKSKSYCLPLEFYCDMVDPPCTDRLDPRICMILKSQKLKALSSALEPTNSTTLPSTMDTRTLLNIIVDAARPARLTTPSPVNTTSPAEYLLRTKSSLEDEQLLAASSNVTLSHPKCPNLFTRIGSKCVSVFFLVKVGWGEARAFCKIIGGELLSFASSQDSDFHNDLLKHLYDIGMTGDFWLGGKYADDALAWTWLDGTPMSLGSPYWGVRYVNECSERNRTRTSKRRFYWHRQRRSCFHYHQAPAGKDSNLCAAMTFKHYFYITDEDCFSLKSPLCVPQGFQVQGALEGEHQDLSL